LTDQEILIELKLCQDDFTYWLTTYARIIEPPTRENVGGVIKFAPWQNVKESIYAFQHYRQIVIIKSRQIGESYIVAAWCLWNALFKSGDISLLFSRGETEAMELLAKCRRMYDQLPPWMRLKLNPDSKTELGFPDRHSTIKAFAATESAGVSFTASRIISDEWPYHPYAEANYLNAKPCIEAGGQFIGLGTVDKLHPDNLATKIFLGAPGNGFFPMFFPYTVRPGRDQKWYDEMKASIPADELQGLTPELYCEQNYPRSIDEALRATQTVAAVDLKVLDEMKRRCTAPVSVQGLDPLIIKIWKPYQVGNVYVAASDTSHGVGKDYNATVVMNVRTGEIVADIFNNTMKPDDFAFYSVELLKHYRHPKWFIEDNDWGATTIDNARKLNYPNFGYQDKEQKKIGWHTGNTNRTLLFANLVTAFNNWGVQIPHYEGLSQFQFLMRNVDLGGRIEAMKGKNDDYPTAVAICVAKSPEILESVSYNYGPIHTLTFAGRR
jgi:hypothetical protein